LSRNVLRESSCNKITFESERSKSRERKREREREMKEIAKIKNKKKTRFVFDGPLYYSLPLLSALQQIDEFRHPDESFNSCDVVVDSTLIYLPPTATL